MLNSGQDFVINHLFLSILAARIESSVGETGSLPLHAMTKMNLVQMSDEELMHLASITRHSSLISTEQCYQELKNRVRELKATMSQWIKDLPEEYSIQQTKRKNKVLIIEDDVTLGQKLLVTFTRAGFITDYATDYQQGYQKIIRFEPDLVVMESVQADGSGFIFCAELRKHFDIPVIMLGTQSDEQTWEWIIKSGADHYEIKPCKHLALIARAKSILYRRNLTQPNADLIMRKANERN